MATTKKTSTSEVQDEAFVSPKTARNASVQAEKESGKVFAPNLIKGAKEEIKLLPAPKPGPFRVRLGALVSLADTNIPDAKEGMRSINKSHLESLLSARDEEIPPVGVQNSTIGFIVYDGYHRWLRAIKLATRQFVANNAKDLTEEEVRDFVEAGIETEEIKKYLSGHQDSLNGYIDSRTIVVLGRHFNNDADLVLAAKMANLSHGLPASGTERCKLAVWFLKNAAERGEPLSLRAAAKKAGVSHVAVIHYQNAPIRLTEQLEKTGSLTEEQEQMLVQQELTLATKNAKTFASFLKKVYEDTKEDPMSASVLFIGQFFTDADYDAVSTMVTVLTEVQDKLEMEEEEVIE
jgi:hypothetical protein